MSFREMYNVDHLRKTEVMATDHEPTIPELLDDCIAIQPPVHATTTAKPSSAAPLSLQHSTEV